jgi:hypothetical protein
MAKLVIEIEMGNDAMHDMLDVSTALYDAATRVADLADDIPWRLPVRDDNGSTVGSMTLQL